MTPLAQIQCSFAAHIRDPQHNPMPFGVQPRRMAMYHELFYNNIESFLSSNFPILRSLFDDLAWHAMARDFFARHRCHTPYFYAIPAEFLAYLSNERGEQADDPPFTLELAHYEWMETVIAIAQGETPPPLPNDPLQHPLNLSELARPLAYRWPVHQLGPDYQPPQIPAELTLLVVYRDRHDQVKFLEINPATYRLLELLQADPGKTGADYLGLIAVELQHPAPDKVLQGGAEILLGLAERNIIGCANA